MKKFVFASSNEHKISEINRMFSKMLPDVEIISMKQAGFTDEIVENGETFSENALIKAKAVADKVNLPVIADDSGLAVDALGGRPGVYSARYGGEKCVTYADKMKLLLSELENVSGDERSAKFVSVFVGVFPDGNIIKAVGETKGIIAKNPVGDGTFGYDPIFYYPESKKTFAEMTSDEKNAVSHRGKAVEKFVSEYKKLYNL